MTAPRARPRALIFDMDGLMLDTEPLAARAWLDAARVAGLEFDMAVTPALVGRTFVDCRGVIAAHHGPGYAVDALLSGWHAAYDALVEREGLVVKPGLLELLDWLDAHELPRAVATSTRRERALAKLSRVALVDRFEAVVGGDEIARGKPEPDIFLEAARRLGCAPVHCLVLEDSMPGFIAATRAGMGAIVVPDINAAPGGSHDPEASIMASLSEVRDFLDGLAPASARDPVR